MANFQSYSVIRQDFFVAIKFWHTLAGLYIWEFVTTLDYEWSVIRGRRPYRWTLVIYSVTRVASLLGVILFLIDFNPAAQYNCKVVFIIEFISGYLTFAAASFLVVLRSIAIWNWNKWVIVMATGVWVTNLGFLIHNIAQMRPARTPADAICTVNILNTRFNTITIFITDIILLLIMLVGLLRLGFHQSGMFGLGHLMWRQGLIWLFLAIIAYIPPLVFISLNLNDAFNYMFQFPLMITISIAATRIYRSLIDFSSRSTDIAFICDKPHPVDIVTSKFDRDPAQRISLELVEVSEHNGTFEQPLGSQTDEHAPFISTDGTQDDKRVGAAGLGLDYDVERIAESGTLTPRE